MEIKSKVTKVAFAHNGESAAYEGSYDVNQDGGVTSITITAKDANSNPIGQFNCTEGQSANINTWNGSNLGIIAEMASLAEAIKADPIPEDEPAQD